MLNSQQNDHFLCPYCNERNELFVDFTAGRFQKFLTDCEVCCAPIIVHLETDGENVIAVDAQQENE